MNNQEWNKKYTQLIKLITERNISIIKNEVQKAKSAGLDEEALQSPIFVAYLEKKIREGVRSIFRAPVDNDQEEANAKLIDWINEQKQQYKENDTYEMYEKQLEDLNHFLDDYNNNSEAETIDDEINNNLTY